MPAPNPIRRRRPVHLGLDATSYLPFEHSGSQSADSAAARTADAMTKGIGIRILAGGIGFVVVLLLRLFVVQDKTLPLECLLTLLTFVLPASGTCGRLGSAETMLFFIATTFALRDVDMRTREMIAQALVVDFLLWKMRLRVWLIFVLSVVILGGQFAIPVFLGGGTDALIQTPPRDMYWQLVVQFTLAIHAAWFVRSNGFLSDLRHSTLSIGSELIRRWMKFASATPVLRFVVPMLGTLFLSPIRFLGRGIFSVKWMLAAALWGFLMQVEWSAQISIGGLAVATTLLLRLRTSFFNLSQLKAQVSFLVAAVVFNTIVYLAIPRKSLPFLANSIVSAYFILFVSFTRPNPTTGVRTPTSGGGTVQILVEPPFSNISTVVLMLVWFGTLALDFFKQRELGWPEPALFRTGLSLMTIGYGLLLLVSIFFDLVEQQLKLQPTSSSQAVADYGATTTQQGTKKNAVEGSEGYTATRQTDSSEPEVSQPQKVVGKGKRAHDGKAQGAHAQQEDGGEVVAPSNSTTPPSDPPTHGDADSQTSDDSSNHHRSSGNLAGSTENADNGISATTTGSHSHPTNGSIATEGDHDSVPSASLGSAPGGNASATSIGVAGKEGGSDSAPTHSPSNAASSKATGKKSKAELEKERKIWQEQQLQSVMEEEDEGKRRAKKLQEEKRKQDLAKEAAAKLQKEKEDTERKEKERKVADEKSKREKEKELQAKKEKEEVERRQKEGEVAAKKQKDRDSRITAEKEGRRKVEEDEATERGKVLSLAAKGKEERMASTEKQRASADKPAASKPWAAKQNSTAVPRSVDAKSPAAERSPATAASIPEAPGSKSDHAAAAAQVKVRAAPAAICSVDDLQLDQSAPLGATPPALQSPNLNNSGTPSGPKVPLPRSRQSNKPGGGLGSPVVGSERPLGPGLPLSVDDSPFDEPLPPALGLGVITSLLQHSGSSSAVKSPRTGTAAPALPSPRPSAAPASVDKSPSTTSKSAPREKVPAADKETKKESQTASGFAKTFPTAQQTTQPSTADRAPVASISAPQPTTTSPNPAGATPPSIGPLLHSSANSTPTPPTPPISGVSPTGNIQDQIPNFISLLTGPNSGSGAGFGYLTSGSGHSPQDPFATGSLGLPLMSTAQPSTSGGKAPTAKLALSIGGDDSEANAPPGIHSNAGAGHGNGTSQDADFDSMWADVKSLLRDEDDDDVVLSGNLMSQPSASHGTGGMTVGASGMGTGKPLLAIPSPLNGQGAPQQVQLQQAGLPTNTVNSNPNSAPNSPPKMYGGSTAASPMSQGATAAIPQTVQLQQLSSMNTLPQVQTTAGAYNAQATAAPPGYQLVQIQGPGGIPQLAYIYLPGYQAATVPSGQYYSAPAPAAPAQATGQPQYVMVMPGYQYPQSH